MALGDASGRALGLTFGLVSALAGTVSLGCAGPGVDVQLTDHESPGRAAVYRIDWRAQVAPQFANGPLLDLEQSRWSPLEAATPAVVPLLGGARFEVVAAGSDGTLLAFDESGKERWHFRAGATLASPLGLEGKVFVGAANGHLLALTADEGQLIWDFASGDELGSVPVAAGEALFVASHSDTVFSVDRADGKKRWLYRREAPAREFAVRSLGTPLLVNDLVVAGFSDGTVVALRQKDGSVAWQHLTSGGDQLQDSVGSPQSDGQKVFVANYKEGLSALAAADGQILWQRAFPNATQLQLGKGALFASAVGKIAAFDPSTGLPLWEKGLGSRGATGLSTYPGLVLVTTDGPLWFLEAHSGRPVGRAFNPGRGITAAPRLSGRDLFVISNNGWLYALTLL